MCPIFMSILNYNIMVELIAMIIKEFTLQEKTCLFCGKKFIPNSPRQNVCKDNHYAPCPDCGKPVLIKTSYSNFVKYGPRRCPECRAKAIGETRRNRTEAQKKATIEKQKKTMIERYGYENALQVPKIKQKVHDTVKEKYGVDNLSQSKEIQARIKKNSLEKYGVDHYSKDPEIRSHMKSGMIKKYGVKCALQNDSIKKKWKETNLEKYGSDNPAKSDIVKKHAEETNLSKYGVKWAAQSDESISKRTETNLKKYGAPAYIFSSDYLSTLIVDPTKKDEYKKFREDPKAYILSNFDYKPTLHDITLKIGLGENQVGQLVKQKGLYDIVKYTKSYMEDEVFEFIESTDNRIKITRNDRSLIYPQELDLYLPEYNLGIECDPTYTHNSSAGSFNDPPKSYKYHQNKSLKCLKANSYLLHIFGYQWVSRKDIVKSKILQLIGRDTNIEASKCNIKLINDTEASNFISENSFDNFSESFMNVGVLSNEQLVCLVCFSKPKRVPSKYAGVNNIYCITNYVNKLNYHVKDCLNLCIKFFLSQVNCKLLLAYSDCAFDGIQDYKVAGFHIDNISNPSYKPVSMKDDSIVKTSNDSVRVYNSGQIRWVKNIS